MNIAIVSDVFPPKCGGAGWSAYYLARALMLRGHMVRVVLPKEIGDGITRERDYGGLPILEWGYTAKRAPFIANYSRNERLYPRFAAFLEGYFRDQKIEVVHAQHYLSGPPSVMAAQKLGIGSVVTIRDYWPICYWTTMLRGENEVCPAHTVTNLLRCVNNHVAEDLSHEKDGAAQQIAARVAGAALTPAAFYMERNLRLKRHWLGQAGAIVAVSSYVAAALAPYVPAHKTQVIPNFVDVTAVDVALATSDTDAPDDYLFFGSKLEANKGGAMLIDLLRRTRDLLPTGHTLPPLIVAGGGSLRAQVEQEAREAGIGLRALDWLDNDSVLRLMRGSRAVLFPSLWPEPLSRMWLEASAAGALIAALNTGGAPDIIHDGETGLLAQTVPELAVKLARALSDSSYANHIRAGARANVVQNFSQEVVAGRFEALYESLRIGA